MKHKNVLKTNAKIREKIMNLKHYRLIYLNKYKNKKKLLINHIRTHSYR